MEIHVLASSSRGNCSVVSDGTTRLLLECGVRFSKLQEFAGFRITEMAGCLITHEHLDHCRAVNEVMRAGVNCYMSRGTAAALNVSGHRVCLLPLLEVTQIGTWRVMPFDAVHDAAEPIGFVLASGTEKLLYLTDSAYCPYRFEELTHLMIGCNWSRDLLRETHAVHKSRVLRNHMSLERAIDMLRANDLSQVQELWLLHLSDAHSDEAAFQQAVAAATGKPVHVAPR